VDLHTVTCLGSLWSARGRNTWRRYRPTVVSFLRSVSNKTRIMFVSLDMIWWQVSEAILPCCIWRCWRWWGGTHPRTELSNRQDPKPGGNPAAADRWYSPVSARELWLKCASNSAASTVLPNYVGPKLYLYQRINHQLHFSRLKIFSHHPFINQNK